MALGWGSSSAPCSSPDSCGAPEVSSLQLGRGCWMDEDGPGARASTDPGLWSEFHPGPGVVGDRSRVAAESPPFVLQWGREEWGTVWEGGRSSGHTEPGGAVAAGP